MKNRSFFLFFLLFFILISCRKNEDGNYSFWIERWTVASDVVLGTGEGPIECYWIKKDNSSIWVMQEANIEGFNYEVGYEYVIDVLVSRISNPPQDASSLTWKLQSLISKIQKQSENLPHIYRNQEDFLSHSKSHVSEINKDGQFFEGDILINNDSLETKSACIIPRTKYWNNNTVYYTFHPDFTYQSYVSQAIAEWESKTSLNFIEGTGQGNYIEFFHGDGNYSTVGKKGGKQQLSLKFGYSNYGTAIHEIGHAVGLYHEHCRNDRDNYVTIYPLNIISGKEHNFNKYAWGAGADIGIFDFDSVMLYSSDAFSSNGNPTMLTVGGYYFVGQRTHLSTGDVLGVQAIYGPPFHKLTCSTQVIDEYVSGMDDYYEYTAYYTINIYSDKTFTQSATLTSPRTISVTRMNSHYNTATGRIVSTQETYDITIPAGVSTFFIGQEHNCEHYYMSNPVELDVTTYAISPTHTLLN